MGGKGGILPSGMLGRPALAVGYNQSDLQDNIQFTLFHWERDMEDRLVINGLTLVLTCGACPEQYDVYKGDDVVGYMRLRHGHFYADYRGRTVYTASPRGDGVFDSDERIMYLTEACNEIYRAMKRSQPLIDSEIDW